MAKVSIIVPVYKAEKYLHRCIDSILSQTFTDWELLLIDDGSPDRSGEICDEYAQNDARIRVFHKENGGVSSARNMGVATSKGDWIVFVDSDDWCEEKYLADFFNPNIVLKKDDIVLQGRKNDIKGKITPFLLKDKIYSNIAEGIIENNLLTFGAPYCKLYPRILITQNKIFFPKEYSYGEDTTFFLKVLNFSDRIITNSKCNYHYMDAVDNSLSKKDHEFKNLCCFLIDSMELVKKIDLTSNADNKLIKAYIPHYKNLLLRSIANMYRLDYSRRRRIKCFEIIKHDLLFKTNTFQDTIFLGLHLVPKSILEIIFYIIMKLRK